MMHGRDYDAYNGFLHEDDISLVPTEGMILV